ncbi:IS701 family transposase [Amycolatopsis nigrescens]|uniref:IS701 family transposase n=1 Tax=Amycolatopsis nigrescens TaxID=381445 RepID=UPI00037D1378|nr:transposase [Amycolatopsis nigrescens]
MSGVASCSGDLRTLTTSTYRGVNDGALAELCSALFASLPRSDQRKKGIEYIRGLLETNGRKSIRNIAALLGGQATEQSLHHFISSSTWDWDPVRRVLAHYVARSTQPQAWVVRPMVIPKAGQHSVGVDKRFFSTLGQVRNAQQAVGVWAASDEVSCPVNWRLHLPKAWLDDAPRRSRASIPDEMGAETLGDCALEAYLGMAARTELPVRPVVMDAREADVMKTVRKLRAAGVPMLLRVSNTLRLKVADPALPGHSADALPADQIMGAAKDLRRPAMWTGGYPREALRTSLAATVRVRMPNPLQNQNPGQAMRHGELVLLGASENGANWPAELWLTDMVAAQPDGLLRLSRLIRRVDRDFTAIADQVGIRDFAGRSYSGWHRHATLASAAHAVLALGQATGREMNYVS